MRASDMPPEIRAAIRNVTKLLAVRRAEVEVLAEGIARESGLRGFDPCPELVLFDALVERRHAAERDARRALEAEVEAERFRRRAS